MASWLQDRLRAAEELLQAVDRTAKSVSVATTQLPPRTADERPLPVPTSAAAPRPAAAGPTQGARKLPSSTSSSADQPTAAKPAAAPAAQRVPPPAVAAAGQSATASINSDLERRRSDSPAERTAPPGDGIPAGVAINNQKDRAAASAATPAATAAATAGPGEPQVQLVGSPTAAEAAGAVPELENFGAEQRPGAAAAIEGASVPSHPQQEQPQNQQQPAEGPGYQVLQAGRPHFPGESAGEEVEEEQPGAATHRAVPSPFDAAAAPGAQAAGAPAEPVQEQQQQQQQQHSGEGPDSGRSSSGQAPLAAAEAGSLPPGDTAAAVAAAIAAATELQASASAAVPAVPAVPVAEDSGASSAGGSAEVHQQQLAAGGGALGEAAAADAAGEEGAQDADDSKGAAAGAGAGASEREQRLQRVVERLKQRLEQFKAENAQLEEMLAVADAKARGGTGEIERLEDEVARAQAARISAEAALQHALMNKEEEVRSLKDQLDVSTRKCGVLEQQLQSLQEANEELIQERKVSEGQLLQSLRKEIESIERLLEDERAAHAAARKAAAAREHQLESSLTDSGASLARMQREVEERTARLASVEERCGGLEHEVDALTHALRTAEGKLQKQAELAASSSSEVLQARIAELEGAVAAEKAATALAEQGRAAADEELVRLRAEVSSLKRQVAESSSADAGDLQRRLKEVTDLLYLKQTQLERIASEKAAQQLGLERELAAARAEAEAVKRRARTDRAMAAAEDSVVPMDTLGDTYHRLANNQKVGGAVKAGAKFLDATASQVVRILKQYPVGRLVVFGYVLGVHLFIYVLLQRLQRRALIEDHTGVAADLGDPMQVHEHDQLAG